MAAFRRIPLANIRPPAQPLRLGIDDVELDELAASIRAIGIKQPLVVKPADNGTFEVVAGHRRYLAALRAGLTSAPCMVEDAGGDVDAIMLHENIRRADLSPVEEAYAFLRAFELVGKDTDKVAELLKVKRELVERRLNLLSGSVEVLEALQAGAISVGVAEELNRMILQSDRLFYLDYAKRGGATVALVRQWRSEANVRAELEERARAAAAGATSPAAPAPAPSYNPDDYTHHAKPHELSASTEVRDCLFCSLKAEEWRMFKVCVCRDCMTEWRRRQLGAAAGDGDGRHP